MLAAMTGPFRRSFDFRGRSRRSEFAWFVLLQLIVLACAFTAALSLQDEAEAIETMTIGVMVHVAVFGLPMLALQVRRMHDQDKSGWWVLTSAVPYVGAGLILFFMAQPGTWGPNRFGPDPRYRWEGDLFE